MTFYALIREVNEHKKINFLTSDNQRRHLSPTSQYTSKYLCHRLKKHSTFTFIHKRFYCDNQPGSLFYVMLHISCLQACVGLLNNGMLDRDVIRSPAPVNRRPRSRSEKRRLQEKLYLVGIGIPILGERS